MDKIIIRGLQVSTLIGVYAWERKAKQQVQVDAELETDLRKAGQSDQVADTVDYAAVAKTLAQVAARSECQLLEALGERMVEQLLDTYPIAKVILTLTKPDILPNTSQVAVQLTREA